MTILEVLTEQVRTGFFAHDQAAIRAGAQHDGFSYVGQPVTPGFRAVRQPGEAVSVMLLCVDGSLAYGDCAAVQYSGAGGRDPVFSAAQAQDDIARYVAPLLVGRELTSFRDVAGEVDSIRTGDGSQLHTAIRYGVTQAILDAVAQSRRLTMAEVVRDEYETGVDLVPVPMFAHFPSASGYGRCSFVRETEGMTLRMPYCDPKNLAETVDRNGRIRFTSRGRHHRSTHPSTARVAASAVAYPKEQA